MAHVTAAFLPPRRWDALTIGFPSKGPQSEKRIMNNQNRAPESVASFLARVERRCGLPANRIPDAPADIMTGGSIAASSPHGTLVYVDFIGQDEDGVDTYAKCVLVERGSELPPADPDADGIIPSDDV